MLLSTRFAMFLSTFLSVLSFDHFRNNTFYCRLLSKKKKKIFVYSGPKALFLNNLPKETHVLPLLTAKKKKKNGVVQTPTLTVD
jgi:hypothetical protein